MLLGTNGIITRGKTAAEKYKEEAALEKVNMAIVEYETITNITEEEKNDKLIEVLGKYGSAEDKGEYIETIVDGYVFWVYKDSLKIEAKGKDNVPDATEIEIKEESKNITVEVGENLEIQLNIKPEGASTRNVEYISSNPEVVKVNNGNIIAVSPGTAEIKIKTKNEKETTCTVTVKEIEVESISIEPISLSILIGNISEALKVNFTPNNAQNKTITWSSSDTKIATVDAEGKVTAVAEGKCNITATSSNGKEAICSVTVTDGMTIAEAKEAIAKDGLKAHIGDKVIYSPTAGGTWRIFYYDEEGEFGNENKLYLKRDNDISMTNDLNSYYSYQASEDGIEIMKNLNPLWRDYPTENANEVNLYNEKICTWLSDPKNWSRYLVEEEADFAIGAPSLELFVKSYNTWNGGDDKSDSIKYKIYNNNGYLIANVSDEFSYYSGKFSKLKYGPNNIYGWSNPNFAGWLCSPFQKSENSIVYYGCILSTSDGRIHGDGRGTRNRCLNPVVCIK